MSRRRGLAGGIAPNPGLEVKKDQADVAENWAKIFESFNITPATMFRVFNWSIGLLCTILSAMLVVVEPARERMLLQGFLALAVICFALMRWFMWELSRLDTDSTKVAADAKKWAADDKAALSELKARKAAEEKQE